MIPPLSITILFLPLCIILATIPPCWSTVFVVNPIAEQLPLVARINEPYSWSIAPDTFESYDGTLDYTAPSLPDWLSFDPSTLTLSGTPSASDEGNPVVTITASDSSSSVSSLVTLCVTHYPPPTLNIPLATQLYTSNPSLSSVFLLSPGSALQTNNSAVRIPPGWSFSIGFQSDTFTAVNSLYYSALQADDSPLPDWLQFNPKMITFNGVVPMEYNMSSPRTVSLALHASDQEGYTAAALPFDIVAAAHEVSALASLPTINITADASFDVYLLSPDDFSGVLVDGAPIQPSDISVLSIDTTSLDWLQYDQQSRRLSGSPPADLPSSGPLLPVTLTATCNQTIYTNVSLAVVPSYFTSPTLPTLQYTNGDILFDLAQYFSNATAGNMVNLTAAYDPSEASGDLIFDPATSQMTGNVPANFSTSTGSTISHINVTFTAYSFVTHSTSHTSLSIALPASGSPANHSVGQSHLGGLSAAAHARLVLGLEIAFGIVGGLAGLGGFLAAFRRCAKVEDTALGGEEGRSAWTENDRKWYGIDVENVGKDDGYGWSEKVGAAGRPALEIRNYSKPEPSSKGYGGLNLGLQRTLTRTGSHLQSPIDTGQPRIAVMRKAEFFGKIRETVRQVSDKYARGRSTSGRPVIGKPVLLTPPDPFQDESLPFESQPVALPPPSYAGRDPDLGSFVSTANTLSDSPTSSTGDQSIPRRRADFAPPRAAKSQPESHARKVSAESVDSLASNASARTHAAEVVIQTAARATSVRNLKGGSGLPRRSSEDGPQGTTPRPRLVPFTSATQVPVPRLPSTAGGNQHGGTNNGARRIASQRAKVMEPDGHGSEDDLSMAMHYVRSLGGDQLQQQQQNRNFGPGHANPSTPTVSTNVRSSFSSLESSHHGHSLKHGGVKRMLVRAGERFKFKVTLDGDFTGRSLEAGVISGQPVPEFLEIDFGGASKAKGIVAFNGVPTVRDVGEVNVGVYTSDDGECVGRIVVEVVERS